MSILSFETVKDYEDYIARLGPMPRVFDENADNMRKGMADRLMPPKFLLEKVVEQTRGIASQAPEHTPFAQPFATSPKSFSDADKVPRRQDHAATGRHQLKNLPHWRTNSRMRCCIVANVARSRPSKLRREPGKRTVSQVLKLKRYVPAED